MDGREILRIHTLIEPKKRRDRNNFVGEIKRSEIVSVRLDAETF